MIFAMNLTIDHRWSLSQELREVRIHRFGEGDSGLVALTEALGMPPANWRNYENGVVMPANVLPNLVELTQINLPFAALGHGKRFAGRNL